MGTRRSDDDFRREIEAHLDLETERLIADGTAPQEARSLAEWHRRAQNVPRVVCLEEQPSQRRV